VSTGKNNYGFSARVKSRTAAAKSTTDSSLAVSLRDTPAETEIELQVAAVSALSPTSALKKSYGFSARISKPVSSSTTGSSPLPIIVEEREVTKHAQFVQSEKVDESVPIPSSPKVSYGFSSRLVKPPPTVVTPSLTAASIVINPIVEATIEVEAQVEATSGKEADPAIETSSTVDAIKIEASAEAQSTSITTTDATVVIEAIQLVTPLDTEEALQEQVSKEKDRREQRFAELSLLQSQLSRSISKKQEVESIIIREIDQLRVVISEEITTVRKRLSQLTVLYDSFTAALLSKNTLLISESKILEQMKDVRSKITEQVILSQLDEAVEKKSYLIDIERGICDEIKTCGENINAEIAETKMKLLFLSDTYAALPPVEDTEAARKYSWTEVEALQSSLLDSIKSSLAVDSKVKEFTSTFSSVMRRRGLILGENTEIPAEVAATIVAEFPFPRETSVDEVSSAVESVPSEQSRMTREELASILGSQSDAEFSATATEALRRTVSSIAAATASIFDITRSFFKSSEAEDAKQSISVAATALVDIGKSVSDAFSAARNVWSSEVDATSEKVETTDEYVATLLKGVNRILNSEQVKGAISDASKNAQLGAKELGVATSKTSSRISTDFRQSAGWQAALRDLSSSVSVLFTILAVGTKRLAGDRLDRQLPK